MKSEHLICQEKNGVYEKKEQYAHLSKADNLCKYSLKAIGKRILY